MESEETRIIKEEVKPIITGLGYSLLELKLEKSKKLTDIAIVIYKQGGVSLGHCSEVSRNIKPRIDLIESLGTVRLKVSSPGTDRVIKDKQEYEIFIGKGIKILLIDQSEWIGGIIDTVNNGTLSLRQQTKKIEIDINNIKKAKLDYVQEVKNK